MEEQIHQPQPQHSYSQGNFQKYISIAWEILKIVVIAAIIVLPVRYFLFQPFIVKGDSMIPNFQDGNYLIVDEFSYRISTPQRGDVIVLKFPRNTTQRFIKRIIGLPGETIDIKDNKISITKDGKMVTLDEGYIPDSFITDGDTHITLANTEYFVLGDNRPYSYDSRIWGVLPKEDIVGKALLRVYPFTRMTYISNPSY